MSGGQRAACWVPSADSFPDMASLAIPVDFPSEELQALIQTACAKLGYDYWPEAST
jgi:hypothetical protein